MFRLPAPLHATALVLCIAIASPASAASAGGGWTTKCASASHCTASVRSRDQDDKGFGAQLRLSRLRDGQHEFVFIASRRAPADGSAIDVSVDDKPVAHLAPGSDYRRLRGSGTFLLERDAADALLAQMRSGKRIALRYRDTAGEDVTSVLPLQGFASAVERLGISLAKATSSKPPAQRRAVTQRQPAAAVAANTQSVQARLEALLSPQGQVSDTVMATLRSRAPEDWSRFLPELLPAIDACMDRTPGSGVHVTKAWPMVGGMAQVRTRNATVGWFDCVAARDGHRIARFEPVMESAERMPGEESVLFTPPDGQPPDGKCFRHERVVDDYKTPMGWLSVDLCARAGVRLDRP